MAGTTSLYRNGELLRTEPHPARGVFDVPSDEADYRLATNVRWVADPYWWPLSTIVDVTWTFRSANQGSDPTALPLLAVRYAPDVDIHNRAPGRRRFEFPVTVARQDQADPPKLRSLRLEVSYDDGKTWEPAQLRQTDNGWTASITHPDDGFASLRAYATDTNGNTTTQTITRAYAIGKIAWARARTSISHFAHPKLQPRGAAEARHVHRLVSLVRAITGLVPEPDFGSR